PVPERRDHNSAGKRQVGDGQINSDAFHGFLVRRQGKRRRVGAAEGDPHVQVWASTLSHKKAQKAQKNQRSLFCAFCASLWHHFFEARKSLTQSAMLPYTK
ncbi:MAG TPA: hypothetical protein VKA78_14255, partial [Pyrinomonadaceae bacterium]|nr:hypothetical protein [Pyrinomonadaceae bacterium]